MPTSRFSTFFISVLTYCAGQVAAADSLLTVDPAHASVAFVVAAGGQPQAKGQFTDFRGEIMTNFDDPHAGGVSFKVAAHSIDLGPGSINDYARSESFLNVAKYPYISFVSTNVEKIDAQHARVTGNLILRGVTKSISLDVEVDRKLGVTVPIILLKVTGTIDRRDFGMNAGYPVLGEMVHLIVTTEIPSER